MARVKIISPVSGKPDWWRVTDDLGVEHELLSSRSGFDYAVGGEYRLFMPGGKYSPCKFRLLPYKTSRRLRSVAKIGESRPATATALYFYKEKIAELAPHDENRTVRKITGGRAWFEEGGCASIAEGEEGLYRQGDCVAVIHERPQSGNRPCLNQGGYEPFVAGFGCAQTPRPLQNASHCSTLYEDFSGYPDPAPDLSSGSASLAKVEKGNNEIGDWSVNVAQPYAGDGMPYGTPADVSMDGLLKIETAPLEAEVGYAQGEDLEQRYPRPMLMPVDLGLYNPTASAIVSPPVAVSASVTRNLVCGGARLKMKLNLVTRDKYGHYFDVDGLGTGIQLPACLALVFSGSPYPDYIGGAAINGSLYTADGVPMYNAVRECNLDQPFTLVYCAPGAHDFSSLRLDYPGAGASGQYALYRPAPRRRADGSFAPVGGALDISQHLFNAPMSDPETGFASAAGLLQSRCFDFYGDDATPTPKSFPSGGLFPGYFEIGENREVTRDVYADFMAAYPFMGNAQINDGNALPALSAIYFYAQGKIHKDTAGNWRANPALLECRKLEFFY